MLANHPNARIIGGDRIIFSIRGNNRYRLVVRVSYQYKIVYIRFFGTHAEYDRIDAARVLIWLPSIPSELKKTTKRHLPGWTKSPTRRFGTPEGDELDVLTDLILVYEDKHYPIEPSNLIGAIEFCLEQRGMTDDDLIPMIGSRQKVAEVLSGESDITMPMARSLHEQLGIPAESLL